jgi:hypothetical protein
MGQSLPAHEMIGNAKKQTPTHAVLLLSRQAGHMDDCLDNPVRVVRYEVECRLRFIQVKVMGCERVDIDRPTGHQFDGGLRAIVLPTNILQAQFLPSQQVRPETDLLIPWNTNQHQCASWL